MAVRLESELYPPIKAYFAARGYEVKAEVRGCDLVALRPGEETPVVVEMKKTFTLPLLLQGVDRQRTGASVWLAVERNRVKKGAHNQRFPDLAALCARLGLGLMTVTFYKTKEPVIEVWREPREPGPAGGRSAPAPSAPALPGGAAAAAEEAFAAGYAAAAGGRRRAGAKPLLREFAGRSGDYNVGGSTGRKLVTAYRERAIRCALALACRGRLAPRQVKALAACPDAGAMLRDNHYAWFRRAERGIYELTDEGHAALRQFGEVTAVWAAKLEWAADWERSGEPGSGTSNRENE